MNVERILLGAIPDKEMTQLQDEAYDEDGECQRAAMEMITGQPFEHDYYE